MRDQKSKVYLRLGGFFVITVASILFSWFTCSNMIGFVINAACFIAMAVTIILGFGLSLSHKDKKGLLALGAAVDELENARLRLSEAYKNGSDFQTLFEGDQSTPPLFQLPWLKSAFCSHREEIDCLHRDTRSFQYADIADYMNSELLSQIGFASRNDLVGGTMTGLGILGTFLGLMIGLRDFDPTTADSMMLTIPPLIEGIKIAFLTSILGVSFSILFNMFYRSLSETAEASLERFVNEYYHDVQPKPENDGFTQLIQYQQEQSSSMSQLAEQISLTMANALTSSVVPTFQKIEATIDQLSARLAETQNQNMGRIADEFVKNMNRSISDQMVHLNENIQQLCSWQDTIVTQMAAHMESFQAAGDRMDQVGTGMEHTISSMETYVKNMTEASASVQKQLKTVGTAFDGILGKLDIQQEKIVQMLDAENHLLESVNSVEQLVSAREAKTLETTTQFREEISSICESVRQSLQQSTDGTVELISETQQMVEHLKSTITGIGEGLCKNLQESTAETTRSVNEAMKASATETIAAINKAMDAQMEQIQGHLDGVDEIQTTFVESMQEASTQLIQASGQISETACKTLQESSNETVRIINDVIKSSSSDTFELIQAEMNAQISQIQSNMNSINQTQGAFIDGMKKASEQLSQASKQIGAANVDLTANLDKAMSRTYQEFDRQLSEITRHLSGTITGIREVTEQLPNILKASVNQTQKITTGYLSTIADSQKQLLAAVHSSQNGNDKEN